MSDKESDINPERLPVSARPGDRKLSFRVDADLAERATHRVAQEETSLSAVLRLLLHDYISGRSAPVAYVRQLDALRRELLAIGRNLNQVTRAINAGMGPAGYAEVTSRLTRVMGRVVTQLTQRPPAGTRRG